MMLFLAFLHKYRLYLKRLRTAAMQQANIASALGGREAAYMRLNRLDGPGNFHALIGSAGIATTFLPYTPPSQNLSNPSSTPGNLHEAVSPASQSATVFQGVPFLMGFDQFQRNKNVNRFGDFSSLDDSSILGAAASFADTRPSSINSNNPLIGASNNTKGLQWSFPQPLKGGGFVDQSSPCLQLSETEKKTRAGEQCILEQIKPQVGFAPKSSDAYDDLRTPMIKGVMSISILLLSCF
ncbi:OLC1v1035640C1 [Oldenlandia corymbosa var. corymbosa]|uniref:OLC1v1035640C1 n=1 Tax=Oldenlandia corymbosa var. corymbosa TaxID=529605 RepID=A0AAV1CWL2_OLDCO|nr:OLC1v1035640C1 [Oldenlandia corymbosa var. corymbosa]